MKVRDVMTRDVATVSPDKPVNEVARLMAGRGISGGPVVENGAVVGFVSELDLIVRNTRLEPLAFFALLDGRIPLETPGHYYRKRLQHMRGTEVRDVMTREVLTIGPDEELETLAEMMVRRRVNPTPVVEDGRLVGIVSRADVVRTIAGDLESA